MNDLLHHAFVVAAHQLSRADERWQIQSVHKHLRDCLQHTDRALVGAFPEDDEMGLALVSLLMAVELRERERIATESLRGHLDDRRAGASDTPEHRTLMRTILKARHDREQAMRDICRLFCVKDFDALPSHVQAAVRDALPDKGAMRVRAVRTTRTSK